MLKRLLPAALAFAFLMVPLRAAAVDYTDIWYLPIESGWGVNMVQSDNFIFATFFVYGSGNQPTWYTAQMASDANGNFAGTLYSTVGSYLGAPWDPTKLVVTPAGIASFVPLNAYQGTLSYSIASGPMVTKSIQRQTLTAIALGGNYGGGIEGAYSNANGTCSIAGGYTDTYTLQVTQPGDGTASFQFTFTSNSPTCTLSGALVQFGQLYSIPNATYQCSDGLNTSASMDQIKATAQGIEGTYSAPSVGSNCSEAATFSAVLF
jgi:hypothetical protein